MTTLAVTDLCKDYTLRNGLKFSTLHAVKDVSFELVPGRTVALVGQSGSGKSTIAKLISQLERPTSGSITLGGKPIGTRGKALREYRDQVQMVFQDPFASLNPFHTIGHHLERPLLLHGKATRRTVREKALALLERVNLTPAESYIDRRPHELSGGQRQRVAIARALAPEPTVLVADEPVSMLDVSIRLGVLNLLARLQREENLALLYITHDLATARHFSDEILVMYRGEVVEQGPADDVILRPQAEFTKKLLVAAPEPGANPRFIAEAERRGVPMPDHLANAEDLT
ncbi:ATP-binding cassette domain-containing protein [Brachybacterium muris]|uniref:ABC transporter ATP-binding protein n=1 Tax=Brachybacterium muris TaxID=219301 RepID=UPI00223BC8CF|nr:ATP-binding cassette domain-containing protein [Brachybacterium muris]MCT2262121.1 ATP-binding cassette domain-containing protein [Brachybacterium muris]